MNVLYTETRGAGPDVVLVHGWGMHGGIWDEVAAALADAFRVTRVDLPGHGRSRDMPLGDLSEVAAAVADAVPAPAAWVGWSLGGLVATRVALDRPEAVTRLALIASSPRFVQGADWPAATPAAVLTGFERDLEQDYRATLLRFLALQARGSDTAREDVRALRERLFLHGEPDPAALRQGLKLLEQEDLRPELPALGQPTLVLGGEHDNLAPVAALEAAAARMPRGECDIVPGAGHAPFLSHRATVIALLREFLDG